MHKKSQAQRKRDFRNLESELSQRIQDCQATVDDVESSGSVDMSVWRDHDDERLLNLESQIAPLEHIQSEMAQIKESVSVLSIKLSPAVSRPEPDPKIMQLEENVMQNTRLIAELVSGQADAKVSALSDKASMTAQFNEVNSWMSQNISREDNMVSAWKRLNTRVEKVDGESKACSVHTAMVESSLNQTRNYISSLEEFINEVISFVKSGQSQSHHVEFNMFQGQLWELKYHFDCELRLRLARENRFRGETIVSTRGVFDSV